MIFLVFIWFDLERLSIKHNSNLLNYKVSVTSRTA